MKPWTNLPVGFLDIVLLAILAIASIVVPLAGVIVVARRRGYTRSQARENFQNVLSFSTLAHSIAAFSGACLLMIWWRGASWSQLGFIPVEPTWYAKALLVPLTVFSAIAIVIGLIFIVVKLLKTDPKRLTSDKVESNVYTPQSSAFGIFCLGVLVPIAEEVVFRSVLYAWLRLHVEPIAATLVSAVIFAICHGIGINGFISFFSGIGFAILYEQSGSIYPGMVAHIVNNVVSLVLLGYLQARFVMVKE